MVTGGQAKLLEMFPSSFGGYRVKEQECSPWQQVGEGCFQGVISQGSFRKSEFGTPTQYGPFP